MKATAGIATLLAEGIGDTIRYSLTADPIEEAKAGRQLLEAMGLRERKNIDLIACPSCGRAEVDVYTVAQDAMAAFGEREIPLQVAVMGCVVNGPGEARDADLGIAAGNKRGHLFVKGQNVMVVPEEEMVDTLVEWAEFIHEHGADAALEKAKATKDAARKAAQEDRDRNLGERGEDANESEAVIAENQDSISQAIDGLNRLEETVSELAEQSSAMLAENRAGIRDFSNEGLYEIRNLAVDAQAAVEQFRRVMEEMKRDPARFFLGKPGQVEVE